MRTRVLLLVSFALGVSCKRPDHASVRLEVNSDRPVAVASTFDLRVESDRGSSVFVFAFPDQSVRRPAITSLSVGKEGERQVWCELDAVDVNGKLIEGRWVAGAVPKNYRASGCASKALSPGAYEVALFTQRGEFRRRLTVAADGAVRVFPWENDQGGP